ncbi:M3 family metallopeptidase [Legionella septentrionalis]|uniref:M3 family metallopeptidase n=1 Tax=Legionella septentrionalis TaxID=2498109 RepID=UPI000F8EE1A5|nr:M3 family metallopeptidase [Legionella septentrionalis]RUQ93672.1 M3 family peptidase [Legionella septentrionalis]
MSAAALPQFSDLDIQTFPQRLETLLENNLKRIDHLLENKEYTWERLMQPLEDMDDALERFWAPLSHLHAVVNSTQLRECYQACLPKLTTYEAALGHNHALYEAIKRIDATGLNETQRKIIADTLRDFELSGVALSAEKKQRFEAMQTRLAELSNQFENHVLDASQAYQLHITDARRLEGLPEHALHHASELAQEKNLTGWVLNLEIPCYLAVVTYAEDRELRREMYDAYVTRASDKGPTAGKFDNTDVMDEILALRHEKAQLLGFAHYAELSLATKMARNCQEVVHFLTGLSTRAHAQALQEFNDLQAFARDEYQIAEIAPWDIAFLSEKKKQRLHAISQEELRAYFPLPKVMDGLFAIINKLYGMKLREIHDADSWHPDVTCFALVDKDEQLRGYIYADLFARQNKRGGAWMDSLQTRRKQADGEVQLPIATLTCNFAKPVANKPATLSHDEVLTLFHEMGHCLHHVLTRVDYLSAAGINGVEWDAVELPSQFFENWCWEEEALALLTAHVDSGVPLPAELFAKLLAVKNFQSAMGMLRQLEFSLFDFRIHQEYDADKKDFIGVILADVRKANTVVPVVPYNRFQHSFTHIFAGGYAAGYYSYKWAEVLSSDAFARFEEEGIFNAKTGEDFLKYILEAGGSRKAEEAYLAFRGRPATIDALLRHNGIN